MACSAVALVGRAAVKEAARGAVVLPAEAVMGGVATVAAVKEAAAWEVAWAVGSVVSAGELL